jgi:hypothetical protein
MPHYRTLEEPLWKMFNKKVKTYIKEILPKEHFGLNFSHNNIEFEPEPIKVWKLSDDISHTKFIDYLYKGCKNGPSSSYRMYFPGTYIDILQQPII